MNKKYIFRKTGIICEWDKYQKSKLIAAFSFSPMHDYCYFYKNETALFSNSHILTASSFPQLQYFPD